MRYQNYQARSLSTLIASYAFFTLSSINAFAAESPTADSAGKPQQVTIAGNAAIPVENFFKPQQISSVELSPDGKFVAMMSIGDLNRVMLTVLDVETLKPTIVVRNPSLDVAYFSWINSKRLVFGLRDNNLSTRDIDSTNGIFAVDRDGKNYRQLAEKYQTETLKFRMMKAGTFFLSTTNIDDSNDIFVTQNGGTRNNPAAVLFRVNSVTGEHVAIQSPPYSLNFLTDKSGALRVTTSQKDALTIVNYKDPKTEEWRKLIEFDDRKDAGFVPLFISPNGDLYVSANNGKDITSVYRFDFAKNKTEDDPIVSVNGFDFDGDFSFSKAENKLLGITYESDAPGVLWLDADAKKLQAEVDAQLPNTVNTLSWATTSKSTTVLIRSFSDIHPSSYLLYNRATKKFSAIGESRPEIDSKRMSYKDFVKIKTRDGLEIPAYVTIPKNSAGKNLPMVVMVHGGPYVRGVRWPWNRETQFLASRGYVVIEPEFRGSTGYGTKLHKAGWKQWGLKMQDDIDDTRQWAIDKGYADPKRVCIAGASYGGYAVLMGLIRNPDLYKCGISWVGVSDINLLYDVAWSDTAGSSWERFGMPTLIGDQKADAEQLKTTSPIEQANRLKNPLILAYGAADVRVPLIHGRRLYDKIKEHNKDVEWIVYNNEGHGWRQLENNVDFWTRSEKFLETHIGK